MADEPKKQLIQCGDHKWAPCSIVCKCLADNPARKDWNPVQPAVEGDELDWACDQCVQHLETPDLDNLALVCMHCVKRLRHRAGLPNVGDNIIVRPNEQDAPDVKGEVQEIIPGGYVVACASVLFQIEHKEVLKILS